MAANIAEESVEDISDYFTTSDEEFEVSIDLAESDVDISSESDDDFEPVIPCEFEKTSEYGPTNKLNVDAEPFSYFQLMLEPTFFIQLKDETNKYARLRQQTNPDPTWKPVEVEDIETFIGITVLMGINKLPEINHYWSTDDALGNEFIKKTMSRTQYQSILRYLHVNDNSSQPGKDDENYDKLFKIRPLLDHLEKTFLANFVPGKKVIQPMPMKPIKQLHGMKMRMSACPSTGYAFTFHVYYTGRNNDGSVETNPSLEMQEMSKIGKDGRGKNVIKPGAVVNYNYYRFMGGVDLHDQNRSYYDLGRTSIKWWRYLFWWFLNSAIVNSYILYKMKRTSQQKPAMTHFQFRHLLAKQLCGGRQSLRRVPQKRKIERILSVDSLLGHKLVKMPGRKRVCVMCSKQGKKTVKGGGVESTFGCEQCNVNLCKRMCFAKYHEQCLLK